VEALSNYAIVLLAGWTSGISIYLTILLIGILGKMGILILPGDLKMLSNPFIIALALVLYLIEFFADKIPFVDSAWDTIHTFIRPVGGVVVGYLATTELGPVAQTSFALLTGAVTLESHAVKSASRIAINTSPEPFSNIGMSIAEHSAVLVLFWLVIKHPILAALIVILLIVGSFFFLRMMWRFARKIFKREPNPKPIP
jgi:hypothetical protein